MKFYYTPGACSLATHLALEEAGVGYEALPVDLANKTYAGGDFTKVNPKGQVPALQLNDSSVLTECAAILQYIADLKPEAQLLPKVGELARYRGLEWLNYIATELHKGFGAFFNPASTDEAKAQAAANLSGKLAFVNKQLEGKDYLLGATYSIADAYLFTVLSWSMFVKLDLTPYTKLLGFLERVQQRPATLKTLKAEGLLK